MSTDVSKKDADQLADEDLVTATIDGIEVKVPKGTLVIRAAERLGIEIPRFCDHELPDPVAVCRQCLVEVPDGGNGRPMKPQPSCALTLTDNMVVKTAATSEVAAKMQEGILEFLLINHPLDCPICDKGGECPLQNQSMAHGRGESRYDGVKRTFPKPISLSSQILLDRDRCIMCWRCFRFGQQISGDDFIYLSERGANSQIWSHVERPYHSYFSGNVIQICPVGALTSADYRFQSRPFDLVSTTTTCEHCAAGCELRTDHRHFQVKRRLSGNAPEMNEQWICDKGRFGFYYGRQSDRLTHPMVRRDGELVAASWPEAIDAAVEGLKKAGANVGVLTGGALTRENAYAYSKFARTVLGTNNVDFRSRAYGGVEEAFLASHVAGRTLDQSVTYTDLQNAKHVVLVSFAPEDEAPIVFLRLRKAWRDFGARITTIAPVATNADAKMGANVVLTRPGDELAALRNLDGVDENTIVLFGERASLVPGLLSGAMELVSSAGARWAWVPRRAGEIGAIQAGCLPSLLPGGRLADNADARVDIEAAVGATVPTAAGFDTASMLSRAAAGELAGLITAGIQLVDMPDAALAARALDATFVVSLEARLSDAASHADVIFPVALLEEQAGTFLNWENRERSVKRVNTKSDNVMTDTRVLAALADAMGSDLGFRTPAQAAVELESILDWDGHTSGVLSEAVVEPAHGLVLSSWRLALDDAAGLDGSGKLKETEREGVARMNPTTAAGLGARSGDVVTLGADGARLVFDLEVVEQMADGVVWVPMNSQGRALSTTGYTCGDVVELTVTTEGGAA